MFKTTCHVGILIVFALLLASANGITATGAATPEPTGTVSNKIRGRLVFTSSSEDNNFEVVTLNANGTGLKRLTHNPASDGQYGVAWTHNGKRIAYSSNRDGVFKIFIMEF